MFQYGENRNLIKAVSFTQYNMQNKQITILTTYNVQRSWSAASSRQVGERASSPAATGRQIMCPPYQMLRCPQLIGASGADAGPDSVALLYEK